MGLGTMEEGSLIFLLFELGGGKWEDLVNIIEQIAWNACAIYIYFNLLHTYVGFASCVLEWIWPVDSVQA